jgi:hypothetical protein
VERDKDLSNGGADQTLPRNLGAKIAMHYFRSLPDPAKLRKEARWSGVSSVPGIGERVQPSADVGVGTVTAYFVDTGVLGYWSSWNFTLTRMVHMFIP